MIRRARLKFERDYVQVPNAWMRDGRLSHRARGILAEIMTHSAEWVITVEALIENGTEGRDAVRTAVRELVDHDYLKRERIHVDGRLAGTQYVLNDPDAVDQSDGFSDPLETRASGSRPTKKTYLQEDQENTSDSGLFEVGASVAGKQPDTIEAEFVDWYAAYPRHDARGDGLKAYRAARKKVDASILLDGARFARRRWPEKNGGKFCPLPGSWLRAERWADEADTHDDQVSGEWA